MKSLSGLWLILRVKYVMKDIFVNSMLVLCQLDNFVVLFIELGYENVVVVIVVNGEFVVQYSCGMLLLKIGDKVEIFVLM